MELDKIPHMPAREAFYKAYLHAPNQGEVQRSIAAWMAVEKQGFFTPERVWKDSTGIYSWVKPDKTTAHNLAQWMAAQGIPNPTPGDLLHCTVIRSPEGFAGYAPLEEQSIVKACSEYQPFALKLVGPDREALVLSFPNHEVDEQINQAVALGMSFDWSKDYREPHVTLSYNVGLNFSLNDIKLPDFDLVFLPEEVMPYRNDWADTLKLQGEVLKVGESEQQLVYGWASVVEKDGQAVVDRQGDVIPEEVLAKGVIDFMMDSRVSKTMHIGEATGQIVESMMFTKELQTAMGIDLQKVGWFIGVKIDDQKVWKQIKSGELSMFSIGGQAQWEILDEA